METLKVRPKAYALRLEISEGGAYKQLLDVDEWSICVKIRRFIPRWWIT